MKRFKFLPNYHYEDVLGTSKITLEKSVGKPLRNLKIYGNSVQDGTPSPDNPVEVVSVGDLVDDETDINYGKYKIPVRARGKNLLDYKTFVSRNQTSFPITINNDGSLKYVGSYYIQADGSYLEKGKTYVLSADYTFIGEQGSLLCRIAYLDGTYSSTVAIGMPLTIDGSRQPKYIMIYMSMSSTIYEIEISNIQLEQGDIVTNYEPYIEPITTNIYLDEPLRKIGDYADYIHFKSQKLIRNVEVINDTGTLTIDESLSGIIEPIEEIVKMPHISTFKGTTIYEVATTLAPSQTEVQYYKN